MATPTNTEIGEARAAVTGAISAAILGTALPTDSTTALIAAFKGYGYVGNDGVQQARDLNTDDVLDMNGDIVYVLQTSVEKSYTAELLQVDNSDILKDLFGAANVVETPADATKGKRYAVTDKGDPAPHRILSIDTYRIGPTGVTERSRIVVPDSQPVTVELGALRAGGVRSFTVTWRVFKVASINGYSVEYSDDGVTI